MQRPIQGTQRHNRLLAFRVTGTGTATINESAHLAAITDNGVGDYTLTFTQPFVRTPVVTAGVLTADCIHQISSISTTAVRVKLFDATDGTTAKDGLFHLLVLGWDSADQY